MAARRWLSLASTDALWKERAADKLEQAFAYTNTNKSPSDAPLFGMEEINLMRPSQYRAVAHERIALCRQLVEQMTGGLGSEPTASRRGNAPPDMVLRTIDEISRLLCEVIDTAELCRTTHASPEWRAAGNEAWGAIARYMNEINAYRPVYTALEIALNEGGLDAVDVRMGQLQMHDFRSGGIHLDDEPREYVVQLCAYVGDLSHRFFARVHEDNNDNDDDDNDDNDGEGQDKDDVSHEIVLSASEAGFLSNYRTAQPKRRLANGDRVYALSAHLLDLLVHSPDSSVRRRAYLAGQQRHQANVDVLRELLTARHVLGRALGAESFGDHVMESRILPTPRAAIDFLDGVYEQMRPLIAEEMGQLVAQKQREEAPGSRTSEVVIEEWDRRYYMRKLRMQRFGESTVVVTLGRCMKVLQTVVGSLWGIELQAVPLANNEHCSSDIVKVRVTDVNGGGERRLLGDVYLDLYSRPDKMGSPASYVQQFPREVSPGEWLPARVTIVCNYAQPDKGQDLDLDLNMAETLWHEWGHVLHVLFSRTRHQHTAGTRVPLDFVETPSSLMEHFFWDERVLNLLSPGLSTSRVHGSRNQFFGLDTQHQIFLSMVDLRMHSTDPTVVDPMETFNRVFDEYGVMPYHKGMNPGAFSHLHGYASGYYGYLLCRTASTNLWNTYFQQDPFNPQAGQMIRDSLLQFGGSLNPSDLLSSLLPDPFNTSAFARRTLSL